MVTTCTGRCVLTTSGDGRVVVAGTFALRADELVQRLAVCVDWEFSIIIYTNDNLLLANGFLGQVVELSEVRVLEALFGGKTLVGVELQTAVQQVDRLCRSHRIKVFEIFWFRVSHRRASARTSGSTGRGCSCRQCLLQHALRVGGLERLDVFRGWKARHFDDLLQLVGGRGAREHGLTTKHLPKDAAHRPRIHTCAIMP